MDFTISTVQGNPDKYIPEIFGDAKIEPIAALYGEHLIKEIKKWITTTKVPCVLAFDLDPTQIPGVSIHLDQARPAQFYMGDAGLQYKRPLEPYQREVIIPKFSPVEVTPSNDGTFITLTLPPTLSPNQMALVLPGLNIRDKNGKEFGIGEDSGNPTAVELCVPLNQADLSEIEIISPVTAATYRQGATLYDQSIVVTIHGHADRVEGLWLWAIVHWGLLKYRPILTATFGMDLAEPTASDFSKDENYMGENVWRRFITLGVKSNYSWEGPRKHDVVAFLLSISASMASLLPETCSTDNPPAPL